MSQCLRSPDSPEKLTDTLFLYRSLVPSVPQKEGTREMSRSLKTGRQTH